MSAAYQNKFFVVGFLISLAVVGFLVPCRSWPRGGSAGCGSGRRRGGARGGHRGSGRRRGGARRGHRPAFVVEAIHASRIVREEVVAPICYPPARPSTV
jgi:hypothetical protein